LIEPACKRAGFVAARADHLPDRGLINEYVLDHLIRDAMVIADLTELNPNVFYEIGVRHILRRPCIHVIQEGEKIPFDISGIKTLIYPSWNPARVCDRLANLIRSEIAAPATLLPKRTADVLPILAVKPTREAAYEGAARILRATVPEPGFEHIDIISVFSEAELRYLQEKESEESWQLFFSALSGTIESRDWHVRHLWMVPSRSVLQMLIRKRLLAYNSPRSQIKARLLKNGPPQITPLIIGNSQVLLGFGRTGSHIGASLEITDPAATALSRDFFNVLWSDQRSIIVARGAKLAHPDISSLWKALSK